MRFCVLLSFKPVILYYTYKKRPEFRKNSGLCKTAFINYLEQIYKLILSYQNQDIKKKRALLHYYNQKHKFLQVLFRGRNNFVEIAL